MRIEIDRSKQPAIKRGQQISVVVDGRELIAFKGETAAAVLFANGKRAFRYSEKETIEALPGFYCGMGICFGCLINVDGLLQRACLTEVRQGMQILTRPGEQP